MIIKILRTARLPDGWRLRFGYNHEYETDFLVTTVVGNKKILSEALKVGRKQAKHNFKVMLKFNEK